VVSTESIQKEVMDLFDRLVEKLPHAEYLEVVEVIASDFESRYDCAKEEAENIEDDS
jgi:hypothetical protein